MLTGFFLPYIFQTIQVVYLQRVSLHSTLLSSEEFRVLVVWIRFGRQVIFVNFKRFHNDVEKLITIYSNTTEVFRTGRVNVHFKRQF